MLVAVPTSILPISLDVLVHRSYWMDKTLLKVRPYICTDRIYVVIAYILASLWLLSMKPNF